MTIEAAYTALHGAISGDVHRDEPMARHTSFRIGGPADLYIVCDTVADVALATEVLAAKDVPMTVLGKGTNVLVADAGYRGAVVVLGKEFRRHVVKDDSLQAGAACILAYLVRDAFSQG